MSEDQQDDVQRCIRDSSCAGRAPTDDGTAWLAAETDRPLCDWCQDALVDALDATPELWFRLRNKALDRQGSVIQSEHVKRSRAHSFGLNEHPLFLADNLHWIVTAWADEVINTAGRPNVDRAHQPEGGQVQDACILLRTYLPVWLAHGPVEFAITRDNRDPDDPKAQPTTDEITVEQTGVEACVWLLDWHRAATKAIGHDNLTHYPPEPCPACNVPRVLRRRDGADKVECTNCGKKWTLVMYETFVRAWIGAA